MLFVHWVRFLQKIGKSVTLLRIDIKLVRDETNITFWRFASICLICLIKIETSVSLGARVRVRHDREERIEAKNAKMREKVEHRETVVGSSVATALRPMVLPSSPRATRIARNRSSRDSNSIQHVARDGGKKEERLGIILRETPGSRLCGGWSEASEKVTPTRKELALLPPTASSPSLQSTPLSSSSLSSSNYSTYHLT